MTVKELKELLEDVPDDLQIILAKDAEGNDYSPLDDNYNTGIYVADSTWSGDYHAYDEDKLPINKHNAICFWPIN